MAWGGFKNAHVWALPIGADEIGPSYSMDVRNFKSTSLTSFPRIPYPVPNVGESPELEPLRYPVMPQGQLFLLPHLVSAEALSLVREWLCGVTPGYFPWMALPSPSPSLFLAILS